MEVTVSMPYSDKNRAALDKHEELVKKHYPELRSGRGRRNLILAGTKISKFTKIHYSEYPLIKVTIRWLLWASKHSKKYQE